MSGIGKIVGVVLIVLSLAIGILGALMPLYVVPEIIEPMIDDEIESATFPSDFDEHNVYGGYLNKLDTGSGQWQTTSFTIDRRLQTVEELGNGRLRLEENIKAVVNGTDTEIPDLKKHNQYEIDELTLQLHQFKDLDKDITLEYSESDDVQWIFPHPIEEGEEFNIFNMNILDHSRAEYLGKEQRFGVECFVYRGEEIDYEVPIPQQTAEDLGSLAEGSRMELSLWEKAWVHPMTGSIIDYAKEIQVFLYVPELPEVKYPSDLNSTTGFDGDLVLFDQETASFQTFHDIKAEKYMEVVSSDGYDLTANETVTVTTEEGMELPMLGSDIQVVFDARDGTHTGPKRSGHYLFSPQGAEEMNYSIWDDGFGKEVNAEYMGKETSEFSPLEANIYRIFVENETYLAGGTATLDMTYWVEPTSGIVLDVKKEIVNWRPQDARRLPLDTDMINKTMTLNTTITSYNPLENTMTPMEIYVVQTVNCTGYTNMTYGVAKVTETVTRYLPNGTMMAPPTQTRFGVDAYTMDYVHVDGWSTMDREGQFTFPIGLMNESGDVIPTFRMYNSDLQTSVNVTLENRMEMDGLEVAIYEMNVTGEELSGSELIAILGEDPGLPGVTGIYNCLFEYHVDIFTGTIVDIERYVDIKVVPPTYEFLYDNMDSTSVMFGQFNGENVTVTQTITGEDAGEGYAMLTINKTYLLDDGSPLLPDVSGNVIIDVNTHEVVNETMVGQGHYVLFPPNPTAKDNYTQVQTVAGQQLMGKAIMGEMTSTSVNYTWMNKTMVDGGLFDPMLAGTNWTMTMTYDYMLDIQTGAVLDTAVSIHLEDINMTMPNMTAMISATDATKSSFQMSNAVIGWSLSGMPAPVLDLEMEMYEPESQEAAMKAMATSQMLLVADGTKPALDMEISFNATTKAQMMAKAQATVEQLNALEGGRMLKQVLAANGNKVQHIYYKKVNTDVDVFEDVDGSVEYWADMAKDKEDEVEAVRTRYKTTLPTILFVIAGMGIVVGLVLIMAKGKNTEGAEE